MRKFLTFLLIAIVATGCSSAYETYKLNEEFKVQLSKDGMGGYVWKMKPDSLVTVVNEYDETYFNDTTQLNERNKIFELKANKKGTTELHFIKKRSFEPDSLVPSQNHYLKKIKIK